MKKFRVKVNEREYIVEVSEEGVESVTQSALYHKMHRASRQQGMSPKVRPVMRTGPQRVVSELLSQERYSGSPRGKEKRSNVMT